MGNKLVLIGGGGHCKSVIDVVKRDGMFEKIVITDPRNAVDKSVLGIEIVGADDCLEELRDDGFEYAFITVGSTGFNPLREMLANKASSLGFTFPVIIDPSATVSDFAVIGTGTYIGKNVVVNADSKIGEHCIINTGAIIEHECRVDDFSHVSVGTILCGKVEIGRNSFIGAGSTVIQRLHIGDNVIIGANSTVLKSVEDNMKYYGIVSKSLGGYSINILHMPVSYFFEEVA